MQASATSEIDLIIWSIERAIKILGNPEVTVRKRWKPFSVTSTPMSPRQARSLHTLAKKHESQLWVLHRLYAKRHWCGYHQAQQRYLGSFAAKMCAVVRVLNKRRIYASWAEVEEFAQKLDLWTPLEETVRGTLRPKPKGGWRLIVHNGMMRTAQQLVVRDLLHSIQIDSDFDFTRKCAGGEKGYIKAICDSIGEDRHWWITADVKNFFPSLKPGHFDWLPLPKEVIRNVVFLPKCAKIGINYPKKVSKLPFKDIPLNDVPSYKALIRLIRQGLPTGAVVSPLLARSLLGRELQAIGDGDVARMSYMDDMAIGAWSQASAQATLDTLQKRLISHPAGALELHIDKIRYSPTQGIHALGYRLEPGQGYGDNPVHVKPGKPRIERHKLRLRLALEKAVLEDKDLFEVGFSVWKKWFQSQQAWTKVPKQSIQLSQNIALSYIDDFKLGIPMGGNAPMIAWPKSANTDP